ncbi:hypothetical protein PGO_070050 [Plasmodium gonderi]|uniref:Uncharacterized protein n=1 Tax=Plasmodium gonderi TaxID=77519 RepID=A0A1Y1JCX9_PLAGO|nr:hypothetical protein PGO_070050 [Plasmodium gonderi]GAW80090.1 hypothetical protein PGO_070050 [Plasmodium gonderi]
MKIEKHNIKTKRTCNIKCDKSNETFTAGFGTICITEWTRKTRINILLLIYNTFRTWNNENNDSCNMSFKILMLLSENNLVNAMCKRNSVLSSSKKYGCKTIYLEKKKRKLNEFFTNSNDENHQYDSVDLLDDGVLLGMMNQIILKEKHMREEYSKTDNSQKDVYFSQYFNDENCISRIMDLSEKSRLYRSKYLRLRYRIFRHLKKLLKRLKVFFIMEYKYNKNIIENFRASDFYYFTFQYVKFHNKICCFPLRK